MISSQNIVFIGIINIIFRRHMLSVCYCQSQSQSYITTDSQSASPSCYQVPIWDPRQIFLILPFIIFFFFFYSCGFVDVGRLL
jgi:hypothetical protein